MRTFMAKVYISFIIVFFGVTTPQLICAYDSDTNSQEETSDDLREGYVAGMYSSFGADFRDFEDCAPKQCSLRHALTWTVVGVTATYLVWYNLFSKTTVVMKDVSGQPIPVSMASEEFSKLKTVIDSGHDVSLFHYQDLAVKCVLSCIDGLSGFCATTSYETLLNNQWVSASGDCMNLIDNRNSELVNFASSLGNSFTAFFMKKRS